VNQEGLMAVTAAPVGVGAENALLAVLPEDVRGTLLQGAEVEELAQRRVLWEPGEPVTRLCFPLAGVVSLVTVMRDGDMVEMATVGREGVVGVQALLESDAAASNLRALCQVPGRCVSVPVDNAREIAAGPGPFRRVLDRYVHAMLVTTAQEVACNRLHPLEQRCARWLLTTRDQVDRDEFSLTQEFLAEMLGVRRATVTIAAGMLQKRGLIRYRRGVIEILDPAGLHGASCECYDLIRAELDRVAGGR
jgi:CRP-like cAMP-binding protein